jgi:hypothetical protein
MVKRLFRILDLFAGTQSVKKASAIFVKEYFKKYGIVIEIDYIGIDIYSPEEENLILDLSQDDIVEKVVATLPKGWIPDFIWASPVCRLFSTAAAAKGGNVYFERIRSGIKPRTNMEALQTTQQKDYTLEYITSETTLHLKLVKNMQLVIDYYNTNFVIENPRSSYMVYLLNPLYVPNKVDYCMYGFDYKKPTTIYSNYNLDLKTCNHKKNHQQYPSGYAKRASVPPLLIKQILNIFLG